MRGDQKENEECLSCFPVLDDVVVPGGYKHIMCHMAFDISLILPIKPDLLLGVT